MPNYGFNRGLNEVQCGQDPKTAIQGYFCPLCGGPVHSSGFSGNPFCWGKCYRYFQYADLLKACAKCDEPAQPDTNPPACTDCMAEAGGGNIKEPKEEVQNG